MLNSIRDGTAQIMAHSKNITLTSPFTLLLCPPLTVIVLVLLIITGILLFPVGTLVSIVTLISVSWKAIVRRISEPALNQITKLQNQLKKKQSKLADAKATIRGLFDQIKTERLQHEEQLMQERSKYEKEPGTQTTIPSQQQQQQQNSENPQNLLIPLDVVRKRVSFAIDRSEITNSDPLSPPPARSKTVGLRISQKNHLKNSLRHSKPSSVKVMSRNVQVKIEEEELKKKLEILTTEVQQLSTSKTELENKFQKSELERKMVAEKMKIASHFYNSNLSTLNKTMNDLKQRNIILKEENDQLRVRIRYSEVPSGNSVEEQWKLLRNKESELEKLCTEMRQVISTVGNSGILTNGKKIGYCIKFK